MVSRKQSTDGTADRMGITVIVKNNRKEEAENFGSPGRDSQSLHDDVCRWSCAPRRLTA